MNVLKDILSAPQAGQLGWTLLHFVWQGALVAALLAVALRVLRKRSAGLRYLVATVALLILAVAPVATLLLVDRSVAEVVAVVPAEDELALDAADSEPPPVTGDWEPIEITGTDIPAVEHVPSSAASLSETAPSAEPAPRWVQRVEALLQPWLPWVVGAWVVGVFVLLMWRLIGWASIRRFTRRNVLPVPVELQARLAALAGRLRVTRPVRLLISGIAVVPSVIGWFRPVILLPVAAVAGLTPEQLEAILAHELAHIRRHDYLVNMIQVVIETLLFYHPAVWWISNIIRTAREDCCDDLAVAACGNRIAYARALSAMEDLRAAPMPSIAATGGNLLLRIRRIVGLSDADAPKGKPILAILTVAFILGIVIPMGCMQPEKTPVDPTSVVAEQDAFSSKIAKVLGEGWVPIASGVDDAEEVYRGRRGANAVGARNWIHANPTKPPVDRRYEKLPLEQLALLVLHKVEVPDGPGDLGYRMSSRLAGAWYMWKTRDNAPARQKLCDQILAELQRVRQEKRSLHDVSGWVEPLGPLGGREQIKTLLRAHGPNDFDCCYGPALVRALGVVGNTDDVPFLITKIPERPSDSSASSQITMALNKMLGLSLGVLRRDSRGYVSRTDVSHIDARVWTAVWEAHKAAAESGDSLSAAAARIRFLEIDGKPRNVDMRLLVMRPTGKKGMCLLWEGDAKAPRKLPMPKLSMGYVSMMLASPDGKYLAVDSVGEGAHLLDVIDLPRLIEKGETKILRMLDAFPAGFTIGHWKEDGRLLVTSNLLLTHGGSQPDNLVRAPHVLVFEEAGIYALTIKDGKIEPLSENAKHPVKTFIKQLTSKEPGVSEYAAIALKILKSREALPALKKALAAEPDEDIRETIQDAIDSLKITPLSRIREPITIHDSNLLGLTEAEVLKVWKLDKLEPVPEAPNKKCYLGPTRPGTDVFWQRRWTLTFEKGKVVKHEVVDESGGCILRVPRED